MTWTTAIPIGSLNSRSGMALNLFHMLVSVLIQRFNLVLNLNSEDYRPGDRLFPTRLSTGPPLKLFVFLCPGLTFEIKIHCAAYADTWINHLSL